MKNETTPGGEILTAADVAPPMARTEEAPAYVPMSSPPPATERKAYKHAGDVAADLADIKDANREHFICFDLDVRHRLIARRTVSIGTLTGVEVHPREVFRDAIANGAASVIVAHNHPSGDPTPSKQDVELTTRLRQVAELCGIVMLDHVVVVAGGFISMADRGWG